MNKCSEQSLAIVNTMYYYKKVATEAVVLKQEAEPGSIRKVLGLKICQSTMVNVGTFSGCAVH